MDEHTKSKAGYVAVIGKPNVGKSTLVNNLLGQTIAPVSQRPQTTRVNQLGILTDGEVQMIFVDTPGIHQARHRLGSEMNAASKRARLDADVMLAIFDIAQAPDELDRRVAEYVEEKHPEIPEIVVLNKVDLISPDKLAARWEAYEALFSWRVEPIATIAIDGHNLPEVRNAIKAKLPDGDFYFPTDQITNTYEREISADLIRAAAMNLLRKEVPYGILVRIDEFVERGDVGAFIEATLFVDRETHKGIVIGKGGSMIKQIGANARSEIEAMSGRKVFLELRVKVLEGWQDNPTLLQQYGLAGRSKVKK